MADHFSRFYASVNAEWPPFQQTADEAAAQERRWRFVLGTFPTSALSHALQKAIASCKKRPKVAELVEWAREGAPKDFRRPERPEPHWTRCGCGCGGKRWLLVLRDANGELRRHASTVEAMTDKLPHTIMANLSVRDQLAPLCGQPMTRAKCQCLAHGGDELPEEAYYVGLEGDVPVYDVRRSAP